MKKNNHWAIDYNVEDPMGGSSFNIKLPQLSPDLLESNPGST
jgi:hypothetical protein